MKHLKISIITVSYNAEQTIRKCMESVFAQTYKNVEYIVIDGNSVDQTINIVKNYQHRLGYFVSEPDYGIYDAMNKGIIQATGDVIGILNADDYFADANVLKNVATAFQVNQMDVLYGDIDYVNKENKIVRKWNAGTFSLKKIRFGWMPPHPSFYCKKACFEKFGLYHIDYGTAADYELMIRYLFTHKLAVFYLKKVMVKMLVGGQSNQSINSRLKGWFFDLKAMRANHVSMPLIALLCKPLRKISQFFPG